MAHKDLDKKRACDRKYARSPVGKAKRKEQRLMKRYGITIQDYNDILTAQDFSCACCGKHISECRTEFHVDHDHSLWGLESIRGLLCNPCNRGIGYLGDTLEGVENAVSYMRLYYSE